MQEMNDFEGFEEDDRGRELNWFEGFEEDVRGEVDEWEDERGVAEVAYGGENEANGGARGGMNGEQEGAQGGERDRRRVGRVRGGVGRVRGRGVRWRQSRCRLCGRMVSYANMARHERTHRVWDPGGGPYPA